MRFTLTGWHLRVLATMNGMPGTVTGLRRPIISPRHPYCSMYFQSFEHNMPITDWVHASEYLRICMAVRAMAASILFWNDDYSSDENKILTKYLGHSQPVFNPFQLKHYDKTPITNADGTVTTSMVPVTDHSHYPELMPQAFAFKNLDGLHPLLSILFEETEICRRFVNELARTYNAPADPLHPIPDVPLAQYGAFYKHYRLSQQKALMNVTREIDIKTEGVRSLTHMWEVVRLIHD